MNETQRLKNWVKDHQESLAKDRERKKKKPNEWMAEEAGAEVKAYDFWCDECEVDFTQEGYKTVHRLFGDPIVAYRTEHECGNECIRLMTHRDHDDYYIRSDKIQEQRNQYETEFLMHEQYGFNTLYGNPFHKTEKEKEEYVEKVMSSEVGLKGRSLKQKEKLRKLK